MKKQKIFYMVIALLVMSQVYSAFQISHLKSNLQQTENQIINTEDRVQRNISEIYSNVDRQLEEYTSLVTSYVYDVGEIHAETFKVPVTFQLQPKTLTETTEVFLKFGEEKVKMERQGTEFILTKDFDISDEISPTIVIEDKGTEQFENNNNLRVYNLKDEVFPSFALGFEGETSHSGKEPYNYRINGIIAIRTTFANANDSFQDVKYIVTLDDEIIKTYDIKDIEHGETPINDNFELEKGQTLIGKIVAKDRLGFTHEQLIMHYVAGSNKQREPYFEQRSIIAPDGTVIYSFDGNS